MTKIVIQGKDSKSRVVASKHYDLERVLQENIKILPELIPIEEATDEPVMLVTIGVEVSVGSGAIDLLLLGSDGVLTIIETKLAKNPESRREVVGQVLEYAAFVAEWGLEDVRRIANKFLDGRFDAALKDFLRADAEDTSTVNDFLTRLDENLKAGRLRLIVAADRLLESVRKTITFVNRHSDFEIYLLQVTCYEEDDGTRIYVPSLHGYAQKAKPSPRRTQWTWELYQAEPGWSPEDIQRAKTLVSRLEQASRRWQPEVVCRRRDIYLDCSGFAQFGVTNNYKKFGLSLWFELDSNPTEDLPPGIQKETKRLQGTNYLYLYGSLDKLSDDHLTRLCEAALRQAQIEPDP